MPSESSRGLQRPQQAVLRHRDLEPPAVRRHRHGCNRETRRRPPRRAPRHRRSRGSSAAPPRDPRRRRRASACACRPAAAAPAPRGRCGSDRRSATSGSRSRRVEHLRRVPRIGAAGVIMLSKRGQVLRHDRPTRRRRARVCTSGPRRSTSSAAGRSTGPFQMHSRLISGIERERRAGSASAARGRSRSRTRRRRSRGAGSPAPCGACPAPAGRRAGPRAKLSGPAQSVDCRPPSRASDGIRRPCAVVGEQPQRAIEIRLAAAVRPGDDVEPRRAATTRSRSER